MQEQHHAGSPGHWRPEHVNHRALFWFNMLRQVRYAAAIAAAAYIFSFVADKLMASPWLFGPSLLAWGPAVNLSSELLLLAALLLAIFVGTLITWPDGPHAGFFTASLGLMWVAIKWGPITPLLLAHPHDLPRTWRLLTLQSVYWFIFVLIGELAGRVIFRVLGGNKIWLHMLGMDGPWQTGPAPDGLLMPYSARNVVAGDDRQSAAMVLTVNAAGFALALAIGESLMMLLAQSQAVNQELFAAFVSFGLAAFIAALVFSTVTTWALFSAVPIGLMTSYLIVLHKTPTYPGVAAFAPAGLLPVAQISAGLAGAIFGFYAALRMNLHSRHVANQLPEAVELPAGQSATAG